MQMWKDILQAAIWNALLEHYQKQVENKSYIKVERAWCGCCNTAIVRYLPPSEGALDLQHKNISLADNPFHQQNSQQQPESLTLW